jgi:hypothetical protein
VSGRLAPAGPEEFSLRTPRARPARTLFVARLLSAAAPLIATAALATSTLAGPAPATFTQSLLVPPNCSVRSSALDQLKIPDCLGE